MPKTQTKRGKKRGRSPKHGYKGEYPDRMDGRWELWSRPLYDFIDKAPRTWTQIEQWAEQNKTGNELLQELTSWLELNGKLSCTKIVGEGSVTAVWMTVKTPTVDAAPVDERCNVCNGLLKTEDWQEWRCSMCARVFYRQNLKVN